MSCMPQTLYEKLWSTHVVREAVGEPTLLYIDLHLIHEVTSPQAFAGLAKRGLKVRRPERTVATIDHAVPSRGRFEKVWPVKQAQAQAEMLVQNCTQHGITLYGIDSEHQGIVHMIGPELGLTRPGMTIVCGDSHTSTHGAFGALAFGIGTSEVEHVLATQCLLQYKTKTMAITVDGALSKGVYSKDIILAIINKIGVSGGTGYTFEYRGSAIEALSMEARMTMCNMSIEAGARAGMIAPDQVTVDYLMERVRLSLEKTRESRPASGLRSVLRRDSSRHKSGIRARHASQGSLKGKSHLEDRKLEGIKDLLRDAPEEVRESVVEHWISFRSDPDAVFDKEVYLSADDIEPMVTWGTNPGMSVKISEKTPLDTNDPDIKKAYEYMDMKPGQSMIGQPIDYVFFGSCTNARIEDLRIAGTILKGNRVAKGKTAYVVPGSMQVKMQAEREGLRDIFVDAGCEWRDPGCSSCLAMNGDTIPAGTYCASTSNRNFMGRQGPGARTFLMSPAMAAVAAIEGEIRDVREYI